MQAIGTPVQLARVGAPPWAAVVLAALVLAAAATDLRWKKVPFWLTYPAMLIALVGHTLDAHLAGDWRGGPDRLGLVGSLAGLAVGFFPLALFWAAGAIGGGDVKLMAAIGALAGWRFALSALVYGLIAAAVLAVFVMVRQRVVRQTLRRVWHTLALLLVRARPADPTGPDSPKIPFAVALCVGTAGAMLESLTGFGLGGMLVGS